MQIIINRGINNALSKVIVFKNSTEVASCAYKEDCIDLDVTQNDLIEIKLRLLDSSSLTISSFTYQAGFEGVYVGGSKVYRICELIAYSILPYLCMLFLVLRSSVTSEAYEWFCASFVVVTALTLVGLKVGMLFPALRKKMYRLHYL